MRKKAIFFVRLFLFIILVAWIGISVVRISFDYERIYKDDIPWIRLRDTQKREKIFADVYLYTVFIADNTNKNASIISFYPDDRAHYLGKYYLYPRTYSNFTNTTEFVSHMKKTSYAYIAVAVKNDIPADLQNVITEKQYILIKTQKGKIYTFYLFKK